ncbi:pyridoxamine 5'-phosphate oxidase family protein [Jiella marina]|uniref:pyridoxamine 5'-phosphate oxidase family protein n=1 Tax=Jiella sp. LLJ827 TaxID=2917712 RepID=UPI0021008377|nr:pyridoxamine 5'-phosphate oxidase family protein [Jiella sp. LLJ827]MCQ0988236.1 pyridoxamine 5'-phosphate oxidase family protein [Jiella sp. LLJ827]
MTRRFVDIATTSSVRAAQLAAGVTRRHREPETQTECDSLTAHERAFIQERDSFYMASVSETGWPYVQHRGGAPGFLKVLNDTTLAFPDYRGNRQYLSVGNLAADDRTMLFLMDYARRARLKIFGRVETVDIQAEPDLAQQVIDPSDEAKFERIFRIRVEAFDWNCPQHITPRFTEADIAHALRHLTDRIANLEAENARLSAELANQTGE